MSAALLTPRRSLAAILWGGFVVGTADIGVAMLIYRAEPISVMQSIASGLLGKQAYQGGIPVALMGLLVQWAMSIIIAAIFVFAARRLPGLLRHWIVGGMAYGAVSFVVMNYLVVPLSAAGQGSMPHFTLLKLVENLVAMIVFGVVFAYFARRFAGDEDPPVRMA
jgi:hypothetical protein